MTLPSDTHATLENLTRYVLLGGLVEEKRVLDVACGDAQGLLVFAEAGAYELTGMTDTPAAAAAVVAQSEVDGVDIVSEPEALPLPFEDAAFDVVVCHDFAQRFSAEPGWRDELRRILAPGGHLVCSVPNPEGHGLAELGGEEAESALTYEQAFDVLSDQFGEAALYAQSPVVAALFYDCESDEEDPELSFDRSLLSDDSEDAGSYVMIFGPKPPHRDDLLVVEIPFARAVQALPWSDEDEREGADTDGAVEVEAAPADVDEDGDATDDDTRWPVAAQVIAAQEERIRDLEALLREATPPERPAAARGTAAEIADLRAQLREREELLDAERESRADNAEAPGLTFEDAETLAQLTVERDGLLEQLEAVNTSRDAFQEQLETVSASRDAFQEQLETVSASRDAFQEQLETVSASRDAFQEQLETVSTSRDAFQEQLETVNASRNALQEQLQEHQAVLRSREELIEADRATTHQQLAELRESLAEAQHQRDALEQRLRVSEQQRIAASDSGVEDTLRAQVAALEADLDATRARMEVSEAEAGKMEALKAQLNLAQQRTTAALEAEQGRFAELERRLEALTSERDHSLAEAETRIESLEAELQARSAQQLASERSRADQVAELEARLSASERLVEAHTAVDSQAEASQARLANELELAQGRVATLETARSALTDQVATLEAEMGQRVAEKTDALEVAVQERAQFAEQCKALARKVTDLEASAEEASKAAEAEAVQARADVERTVADLQARLAVATSETADAEAQAESRLQRAQEALAVAQSEAETLRDQVSQLEAARGEQAAAIQREVEAAVASVATEMEQLKGQLVSLEAQRGSSEERLEAAEAARAEAERSLQALEQQQQEHVAAMGDLEARARLAEARAAELEAEASQNGAAPEQFEALQTNLEALRSELDQQRLAFEERAHRASELEEALERYRQDNATFETQIKDLLEETAALRQTVASQVPAESLEALEQRHAALTEELRQSQEQVRSLESERQAWRSAASVGEAPTDGRTAHGVNVHRDAIGRELESSLEEIEDLLSSAVPTPRTGR